MLGRYDDLEVYRSAPKGGNKGVKGRGVYLIIFY